jgi:hypothetical protein
MGKNKGKAKSQAAVRPMQGMDNKTFLMNDVVPIVISNPGNNLTYRVIIQLDVNGYTWEVQSTPGNPVDTGSGPYGRTTG